MKYFVRFFTTMAIGLPLCVIVMKDTKSALLLLFSVLATVISITQHVYFSYIEDETRENVSEGLKRLEKEYARKYKSQISSFERNHFNFLLENIHKNPILYKGLIDMLLKFY